MADRGAQRRARGVEDEFTTTPRGDGGSLSVEVGWHAAWQTATCDDPLILCFLQDIEGPIPLVLLDVRTLCVGLCGLTEEEVLAIAEHEHLPEIAALAAFALQQRRRLRRGAYLRGQVDLRA